MTVTSTKASATTRTTSPRSAGQTDAGHEFPRILRNCCAVEVKIEWKWAEEQGYFGGVFNISCEDINDVYHEGDDAAYDLCEEVIGYSQRDYFDEDGGEEEA